MTRRDDQAEGVIKFTAHHRDEALSGARYGELACRLIAWREILARTGLVGRDPARYEGYGYGNVSARVGPRGASLGRRAFVITGTQTSGHRCLTLDELCLVERYDRLANSVWSRGRCLPSSESMTHGAIYDLAPTIRVVFHAHCPTIWRRAQALRLPATPTDVPYGTPEMADAAQRLYRSTALATGRVLVMGGHADGIIAFGETADEAGQAILRTLAAAYEAQCRDDGVVLCRTDD